MKLGLAMTGVRLSDQARLAVAAEELGYESVWVPDHVALPAELTDEYPYGDGAGVIVKPDLPLFDPWVILTHLAAATSRVRLGIAVLLLALRHPLVVGRAAMTLDRISGGRLSLGVGVGWLRGEYELLGISPRVRGRRTDESLEILRLLWEPGVVEYKGSILSLPPMHFEPKPRQRPGPPILVGGSSAAALERAARLGDGWMEIGIGDHGDLAVKLEELQAARRRFGRDQEPFEVSVSSALAADREALAECRRLGVGRLIFAPAAEEAREVSAAIEMAAEFAARVRRRGQRRKTRDGSIAAVRSSQPPSS